MVTRHVAWRPIMLGALQAARAVVARLAPAAGQRVVAGRAAGYRSWDPRGDRRGHRRRAGGHRRPATTRRAWNPCSPKRRGNEGSSEGRAPETPNPRPCHRGDGPLRWEPAVSPGNPGALVHRGGHLRAGRHGPHRRRDPPQHGRGRASGPRGGPSESPDPGPERLPLHPAPTRELTGAFLETYMKKPQFLYATSTALRPLMERAAFIFPNGGPGGFVDVAAGRVDVYFAWNEALTEVYSAAYIAERAGCVVTGWDGSPVRFTPDIHAVYRLVCSANAALHRQGAGRPENRQTPERTRPMKLGCICGTFNRSFDGGAMDQIRFLHRCAADLQVQGVELQDIHFPQTRSGLPGDPAPDRARARTCPSSPSARTTTSAGPTPPCARARSPRSSSGSRLPSSSACCWSASLPGTPRATARSDGQP